MYYERRIGIRLASYLIDAFIVGVIGTFLMQLGLGESYYIANVEVTVLPYWQNYLLLMIYYVGFAVFNEGISIGKLATGIRIKDLNNNDLSSNKLILRAVLKTLLLPIALISFIVLLLRKDKRTIHDLLVDSVVCKQRVSFKKHVNVEENTESYEYMTNYHFDQDRRQQNINHRPKKDETSSSGKFGDYNQGETSDKQDDTKSPKKEDEYKDPFDDYYN